MPILPPTLRAGTRDLPDVPPLALSLLSLFLAPILAWVSQQLYRAVLSRCAAHPLVRLAQLYDFAPVVAACQAYQHAPGTKGSPPTYSINQLVRAEFVRAWADSCSDPELEWLLASNLLVRWFVELPLLGPTPDHSTLSRFHAWVSVHQPDALFRNVLTFLDQVDPEDPATTPQIVDTFAMASPAAPSPAPDHLLRHLIRRLVAQWFAEAPAACQAAIPPLDLGSLYHVAIPHTPLARQQLLQQSVTLATWLVEGVTPHLRALDRSLRASIAAQLAAIEKVIADETTTDAAGMVQERALNHKGSYRVMSAVDLESTFRKHEGSPAVFGTNAVVSTTATRIRAVVALTGSTPDGEGTIAVLEQQRAAKQPLPPFLIMDRAAGYGKYRARVDVASDGATLLVAHTPPSGGADFTRFTPADFRVSADGTSCTCPNGVTTTRSYAHDREGLSFRFLAAECRDCPLWSECRAPESNPRGHRMVYVTPYHAYLRAAERFNATEEGKGLLHSRWQVEPTVAWLVRYQGCRQARRVGLAAAQCQLYQASAVRNLLLWLSRIDRGLARAPTTRAASDDGG